MFPFKKKSSVKMTKVQIHTEKEAVRILTQAQKLLEEGDQYVHEAQRLRYEVTHELLPPQRMYILRKHPRSLLLDVDRRIQHAHIRNLREGKSVGQYGTFYPAGAMNPVKQENPVRQKSTLKETKKKYAGRYGTMAETVQKQFQSTIIWYSILSLLFVLSLFYLQQYLASNDFQRAFMWLYR